MEQSLYEACTSGDDEKVRKLLKNENIDTNWQDGGWTPFYAACGNGHIEIVKLLLNDKRVDVNQTDCAPMARGWTPFSHACYWGKTGVVKYLLESRREIDINKKDNNGKTGLDCAIENGKTDIVELIESFQKNPNETRAKLRKELGIFGNLFII